MGKPQNDKSVANREVLLLLSLSNQSSSPSNPPPRFPYFHCIFAAGAVMLLAGAIWGMKKRGKREAVLSVSKADS